MTSVLVVCRVENSQKVPAWMRALDGSATFLCSGYGAEQEPGTHHYRGGKWAGIYNFFSEQPELLHAHDYFWFPDDDIDTTADIASSFLALCIENGFELAQPALTPHSYFAYRETIENPRFCFRRTNFVELMMPLMKKEFLIKVLPFFEGKHAALGIDWIWQTAAIKPYENVAIVDACPMSHTRPRNLHLAKKMRDQNISIAEEKAATFETFKIKQIIPVVYGGQLKNGVETRNRFRLLGELLIGYLNIRKKVKNGRWTMKNTLNLLLRQLSGRSQI